MNWAVNTDLTENWVVNQSIFDGLCSSRYLYKTINTSLSLSLACLPGAFPLHLSFLSLLLLLLVLLYM